MWTSRPGDGGGVRDWKALLVTLLGRQRGTEQPWGHQAGRTAWAGRAPAAVADSTHRGHRGPGWASQPWPQKWPKKPCCRPLCPVVGALLSQPLGIWSEGGVCKQPFVKGPLVHHETTSQSLGTQATQGHLAGVGAGRRPARCGLSVHSLFRSEPRKRLPKNQALCFPRPDTDLERSPLSERSHLFTRNLSVSGHA